jgi:hypothetical protein
MLDLGFTQQARSLISAYAGCKPPPSSSLRPKQLHVLVCGDRSLCSLGSTRTGWVENTSISAQNFISKSLQTGTDRADIEFFAQPAASTADILHLMKSKYNTKRYGTQTTSVGLACLALSDLVSRCRYGSSKVHVDRCSNIQVVMEQFSQWMSTTFDVPIMVIRGDTDVWMLESTFDVCANFLRSTARAHGCFVVTGADLSCHLHEKPKQSESNEHLCSITGHVVGLAQHSQAHVLATTKVQRCCRNSTR